MEPLFVIVPLLLGSAYVLFVPLASRGFVIFDVQPGLGFNICLCWVAAITATVALVGLHLYLQIDLSLPVLLIGPALAVVNTVRAITLHSKKSLR